MAQFIAIPQLPKNIPGDLAQFLSALKENVELLTGTRGDAESHAVLRGDIRTEAPKGTTNQELSDRLSSLIDDMRA